MGYAERASRLAWYSVYSAKWWTRIKIVLALARAPWKFRAFRGEGWRWLLGKKIKSLDRMPLPVMLQPGKILSDEDRTIARFAMHVRDTDHLEELLEGIEDLGDRATVRRKVTKILKARAKASQ